MIDIKHIAKLAHLQLSEEEEKKIAPQLAAVLDYVSKLQNVPTENIEPTSQVTGLVNAFREDEVDTTRMLSQKQALSNAAAAYKGFVKVKIIGTLGQ